MHELGGGPWSSAEYGTDDPCQASASGWLQPLRFGKPVTAAAEPDVDLLSGQASAVRFKPENGWVTARQTT